MAQGCKRDVGKEGLSLGRGEVMDGLPGEAERPVH